MKRILVTGGAGFIGSHLVDALLARGDNVTVIDDCSTGSLENLKSAAKNSRFAFHRGSVGDVELMPQLIAGAEEVFHLAAAVGVDLINTNPIHTIETNINPTETLLKLARTRHSPDRPIKLFLASTSEVYGKNPKPSWTEEDDLVLGPTSRPRWAYGASKAIDEFLTLAYWRQHRLPSVIARFFNVVGPRQTGRYGMVLPRLVDRALAGQSPVVHDDGQQVRCFAHVADVVRAVLLLMYAPDAVGRVFNVGSDQPVSIRELAQRVIGAVDPKLQIEYQSYTEAYSADFEDVRTRVPDLSRLRATIDFRPRFGLDEIIRDVIASRKAGQGN